MRELEAEGGGAVVVSVILVSKLASRRCVTGGPFLLREFDLRLDAVVGRVAELLQTEAQSSASLPVMTDCGTTYP